MSESFRNKVALVTGGGSGIGAAVSGLLAAAGARVAVADIAKDKAEAVAHTIGEDGGRAIGLAVDVSDGASVAAMLEQVVQAFGRLDIAINNAGVGGSGKSIAEIEESEFDRTLRINLKGVWLCMKEEISHFRAQGGGGIIVNTASTMGLIGAPNAADYVASKHAVLGMTKSAAIECSAEGIRINAVCPGVVETPLIAGASLSAAQREGLIGLHPIGRVGRPEEIAEAIMWLASPAASFVAGAGLVVDGGWTAW